MVENNFRARELSYCQPHIFRQDENVSIAVQRFEFSWAYGPSAIAEPSQPEIISVVPYIGVESARIEYIDMPIHLLLTAGRAIMRPCSIKNSLPESCACRLNRNEVAHRWVFLFTQWFFEVSFCVL